MATNKEGWLEMKERTVRLRFNPASSPFFSKIVHRTAL